MRELLAQVGYTTQLVTSQITNSFRSKISIFYQTENYTLKTAESTREIELILKLRHQIFCQELQKKKKLFQIELDRYDLKCDHLLILDNASGEIVGTYRLLSSHFFKKFYSENEFDLGQFLAVPATKLELGRACILPEHRHGSVIQLLWRGISEYMKKTQTRFLFGCSSVQTLCPQETVDLTRSLTEAEYTDNQYEIYPLGKYQPKEHEIFWEPSGEVGTNPPSVPPLLQSYFRAGAKVAPIPAIDGDFQCIDFFTILDFETMHPLFKRRYFGA